MSTLDIKGITVAELYRMKKSIRDAIFDRMTMIRESTAGDFVNNLNK